MAADGYKASGMSLARRILPLGIRKILWSLRNGLPLRTIVAASLRDLRTWIERKVPDRWVQARNFRREFGRRLNFAAPRTFNEKIHWLMLNYRVPEMTQFADKFAARARVAARVGTGLLNDLYGVWNDPAEISFEHLPSSFVLKVTSGYKQNIFCHDKSALDVEATRRTLREWMEHNEYWTTREWAYKDIKPRIVAERLLTDEDGNSPADFKIFCFDGEPKMVQVDLDRFTDHRREMFDLDWKRLPFDLAFPSSGRQLPKPGNFEEMIAAARALSRGFPFVRVDLYSLPDRVVFGEMTWYPAGGFERFFPEKYDREIGELLTLPAPAVLPGGGRLAPARPRIAWAAALAAAAVAGFLARSALVEGPVRAATRVHVPAPDGEVVSAALALSPDGQSIAFTTTGARPHLYVHSLASGRSRRIAGTEQARHPFWSPDGRSIAFFSRGFLKRIDLDTGDSARVLGEAPDPRGGAWSRSGEIVFSPSPFTSLYRVSAELPGTAAPVAELDPARKERSHEWPSFLPDGRRYLFVVHSAHPPDSGVYLGEIGSSRKKKILPEPTNAVYADGNILFVRQSSLMAQRFDLDREAVFGDPVPVAAAAGDEAGAQVTAFAGSSSGVIAFRPSKDESTTMRWIDRSGAPLVTVQGSENLAEPDLSPDGGRIVWQGSLPGARVNDIWVTDLKTGVSANLTSRSDSDDVRPVWSPDGRRIAYSSNRGDHYDVYERSLEGDERLLLRSDASKFVDDWSPDGKYLVYEETHPETLTDLWVLPLSGDRKPFAVARSSANEAHAQFSPDGRWIAYVSDEGGRAEVFVSPMPPTGRRLRISTEGGVAPMWRADGKELFYVSFDRRLFAVPVTTAHGFRAGLPRPLFKTSFPPIGMSGERAPYAVDEDGCRFLVRRLDHDSAPTPIVVARNWTAELKR